jgi:hypothetical protein
MQLMFKLPTGPYSANPVVVDALDKLFILHADHEQNCSTSTVRMVGSSHAGLFALFLQEFQHYGGRFMVVQTKQCLKCWKKLIKMVVILINFSKSKRQK